MPTNVLVTGGAGYIGSHTCKSLSRASYLPVVLDNLVSGHRWAVKWGPFVEGNLADGDLLHQVMREHQIQAVVHFAAYAYVGESVQVPEKYFRNNVINTLNLLEAMRAADVRRIVFSSSCATYGLPEIVPIREDAPQRPVNPYGESKLFVERALHWLGNAYGLRWAALRYFNAAGSDPDAELGEDHDPETHLIPLAIQSALGRRPYVEVYGTDYDTPDGTAIRDYIHVTDLAEAHVLALSHLLDRDDSLAVNLGTGQGHSVREVIHVVESVSRRSVLLREGARRPGDPPTLVADASRARELLDWQPRHSSLMNIVGTAFDWHQRQSVTAT